MKLSLQFSPVFVISFDMDDQIAVTMNEAVSSRFISLLLNCSQGHE